MGRSLADFKTMHISSSCYLESDINRLLAEEKEYDVTIMSSEFERLHSNLNREQKIVFNKVIGSVMDNKGGLFFVYGSGGCGKTYLWNTMICFLRSKGKIVLLMASSGIAATLLRGGRTAHSRFGIPILLDDISMCAITSPNERSALLQETSLIIWDEAPMQHRHAFEALDRTLKDVMKFVNPSTADRPFGGITVVLGRDFCQILSVVSRGNRVDIVNATINQSRLWDYCKVFTLNRNMRLLAGTNEEQNKLIKDFGKWVLDVENGQIPNVRQAGDMDSSDINIPSNLLLTSDGDNVHRIIHSTYPDLLLNFRNEAYLRERAILTPTNETIDSINEIIINLLLGEIFTYNSCDSIEEGLGDQNEMETSFPAEYLNSLSLPGLPNHRIKLKVGAVTMLLRHINQTMGLFNDTRMIVTQCLKWTIEAKILTGAMWEANILFP